MPRDDRYAGRRILTGKGGAASAAPLPSNASKEGNEPARLADQFAFRHYRKMLKRLSNYGEQRVHDEIVATADHYAANIYRKVRLADVIDISKLPSRELGRFALQSHFDFCICDDSHMPAFAIEFDGSGHDPRNDAKKDEIARHGELALFRIDERLLNHTRGGVTFLQYLVHTYFLGEAFAEAQRSGAIDPSEPFVMWGFLKPDAKHVFDSDFNFTAAPRTRITAILRGAGKAVEPHPLLSLSGVMLGRDGSSFVGFASISVGHDVVYGRARLEIGTPCLGKLNQVPFGWSALSDYCEGMMLEDLADSLEAYFENGAHVLRTRQEVEHEISELETAGFKMMRGFGGGDDPGLLSFVIPGKRG